MVQQVKTILGTSDRRLDLALEDLDRKVNALLVEKPHAYSHGVIVDTSDSGSYSFIQQWAWTRAEEEVQE